MKIEDQVCSLELAKKLKELKVNQESSLYWVKGKMEYGYEGEINIIRSDNYIIAAALFDKKIKNDYFNIRDHFDVRNYDTYPKSDDEFWDENYQKWETEQKPIEQEYYNSICSAFSVAELGELLPVEAVSEKSPLNTLAYKEGKWMCEVHFQGSKPKRIYADTEADVRAKMLIYLIENKIKENK